jgi:D-cysteine desulfhydrase
MSKPLFQHYPALEKAIPCIELADLPTPVEKLDFPAGNSEGLPGLWIKRDDKSSSLYGGNKVRKLEFALAQARQQGKSSVVTFGAIGTNHGVATALFCQRLEIACRIFLFDQPVTPVVQDNLKLMQCFGAELEFTGSLLRTATRFYREKLLSRNSAYYLTAGGSNVAGCVGFVNAAFELKQQVEQGLLHEPELIYCAVGSGSTAAGLALGCRLAGMGSRVIAVRVAPARVGPVPVITRRTVGSLMARTYRFLKRLDASIPDIELPGINLEENYYGDGYGHPLSAGRDATAFFGRAGITLEPTYTAKTAAAVIGQSAANTAQNILYWHTYNSVDMGEVLAGADPAALPPRLRRVLGRTTVP